MKPLGFPHGRVLLASETRDLVVEIFLLSPLTLNVLDLKYSHISWIHHLLISIHREIPGFSERRSPLAASPGRDVKGRERISTVSSIVPSRNNRRHPDRHLQHGKKT
jgi:hypothetical protein